MELERVDAHEDEPPVEVIAENRFLAARDGMDANLVDPLSGERVSARALLETTIAACLPHAEELGCDDELLCLLGLAAANGAERQRATERRQDFRGVTENLARAYRGDVGRNPEAAGRAA
jgi:carboxylate-amine ligase